MDDLQPVITSNLFPLLDEKLISLLKGLSEEEWGRTALPKWSVKDIAAHLLDTNLRRLSMERDRFWGESFRGSTEQEFKDFLNGLNRDWVHATRRLSPRVLVELLQISGEELAQFLQSLDPYGPAIFPVSWAGEDKSENWFDIAREYTEKWHHQQQIRDAVGQSGIMTPELYRPVLSTFIRVLPYAYRNCEASIGTTVHFQLSGDSGGDYSLVRMGAGWKLKTGIASKLDCAVRIPGELAWKLFTKGLSAETAHQKITVEGNATLGEPIFTATAIVG